jgi:hypothetical protein
VAKALDAACSSLDVPFRKNHWWQSHFLTTDGQDLHGWAEKRRAMLGQAKLALCFQIPSQASLNGILKPHRSFCYANGPSMPRPEFSGKKHGVALGFQAGMCCEKASASPLASVFSTTNPAFAQRINTMFSIFLSVFIRVIRG